MLVGAVEAVGVAVDAAEAVGVVVVVAVAGVVSVLAMVGAEDGTADAPVPKRGVEVAVGVDVATGALPAAVAAVVVVVAGLAVASEDPNEKAGLGEAVVVVFRVEGVAGAAEPNKEVDGVAAEAALPAVVGCAGVNENAGAEAAAAVVGAAEVVEVGARLKPVVAGVAEGVVVLGRPNPVSPVVEVVVGWVAALGVAVAVLPALVPNPPN